MDIGKLNYMITFDNLISVIAQYSNKIMYQTKRRILIILLFIFSVLNTQAQAPYFGIGGNVSVTKINFTNSDGAKSKYKPQLNFNQNLIVGYNLKNGFASELSFGNTVYSGINTSLNHELTITQIQTSLLVGYLSPGKLNWGVLTGVYFGKISNVKSTVDGKSIWEATDPAFDKSDFGSTTKLFINLKKDDSRFQFSPNMIFMFGLKNIEKQDESFKQITKLNSFMLGLNIKYQLTK